MCIEPPVRMYTDFQNGRCGHVVMLILGTECDADGGPNPDL